MDFPFGQDVHRDRRKLVPDPYDPSHQVAGGWDDPDTVVLAGAFVASSSSTAVPDASRTQSIAYKSLYCDPASDVLEGDRIRVGADTYQVLEPAAADVNPFTGWQPAMEIPLKGVKG